ncbi:TetR/AcrR family transcriptional regulator [Nocardioides marmoriginsengisoli]|uniref:TetR/AcrR family transcriptional regulator n=1 Tax=Nocardioides marmoriginsengisoli TaxID=661483 RepID=A0A3N0CRH0_9ACTN|nr:helix-turn-helix domain-containing protein [Nocardioides marmoriginsengisoli]RNL65513.1 TetR/AcrR family transcriptional regulator [Nocardioides marmoriginsengisoli]
MTEPELLPILGQPVPERRDAARNRDALMCAAARLVDSCGVEAVTMDAVAEAAGVGKGTVFRRFGNRAGLMARLLDESEAAFQASVISGPPPLGPDAPPYERLIAFGRARLTSNLANADLLLAASGADTGRSYAAYSFTATHVRYLLGQLGVRGDIALLATALLAPLEVPILRQQVNIEQMDVERIVAGWEDLVGRVVSGPVTP